MPDVLAALLRRRWRAWPSSAPQGSSSAAGREVIATPRLCLRELAVDDAPFVLQLLNDPGFLRYIGDRGVRDLEEARRYIVKGMLHSYERHGYGLWLVQLRAASHQPIGLCGLVARTGLPEPDIGFALLPQWWSQGYAHEAATAVMAHARRVVGLRRVLAIVSPANASSLRLLRKLGFEYQCDVHLPGEAHAVALYASDVQA